MHGLTGQVELIREMYSGTDEATKLDSVLTVAEVCLDSLAAILDVSLVFAQFSNEADTFLSAVSGPREQLDLIDIADFTASVTKAAWVRKMRLTSASGSN
jgi:hypothetical protein